MKTQILAAAAAFCMLAAHGSAWTVRTYHAGDEVSVSEKGGVTEIAFAITPSEQRIDGCARYTGGWADILFASPRALSPQDERILFEMSMPGKSERTKVQLAPLVRDEDGELFCYAAHPAPQLKAPKRAYEFSGAWQRLKTPNFYAGEAGAAAQDVYTIESEGVDFTPGKKLEFLGFRLILKQMEKDWRGCSGSRLRTGKVYLGDVSVAGEKIPYAHPFAYADALLPRKGRWTLSAQIFDEFQGRPIRELSRTIEYDPADPASRRQRVEFPTGPDGCYWIKWQAASGGAVGNSGEFRSDVYFNPDRTPTAAVDVAMAPVMGIMRINPDHPGRGVYGPGEKAEIEVRVFPRPGAKTTVEWTLRPAVFEDVLDSGKLDVSAPGAGGYAALKVVPKESADRSVYRLVVDAKEDGRVVDRQTYFFGRRNGLPLARHDRAGKMPDRREYKKHPYNRTTFTPKGGAAAMKTEGKYLETFREFLENSCELATSFTYMVDLRDWEVLPGVFDTYILDRALDMAADYGMKATIRVAHCDLDSTNLYRWNKYVRQVASDGTVAAGHAHYGAYSVPDELTVRTWLDAYRALHDRYVAHTAFEGYYIMQPGGEWTVVDQPWNGTFCGYDPATAASFRKWLRERGKRESDPPQPDFRGGNVPDLRPEWIDFCRYKATLGDQWMATSLKSIRSYDDDRITISYWSPRAIAKMLGGMLDYGHNGGNHYHRYFWEFIDAWKEHKVGWISEPHHPHAWNAYGDPQEKGWVLDWTTWVMTAQAAGGGANIHVYYHPWKTMSRIDFWGGVQGLDRFETFKPILDELHEMEVFRPKGETAFLTDDMTLWTKHRTTFRARLYDLRLWRETLEQDNVPYGDFLEERAGEYRLVMPNLMDVAMEATTFSNLVRAVRENGAKTLIAAQTGSFVPEIAGGEPFQLLKAFGIAPPERPYCRKGLDVRATFGEDGILAEAGRTLQFETGDRLHAQLLDPEVQKRFRSFRFRWLPETDYFGYYPCVKSGGRVLATFPDGGAAVSLHKAGKGEVIVFWGLPDYDGDNMKGMMAAAVRWAGASNPREGESVKYFIEGENRRLDRHYLLLWKDECGSYVVKAPHISDGTWFLDEMVTGRRIGLFDGKAVREKGVRIDWEEGYSPLKYLRFSLRKSWFRDTAGGWSRKFRNESVEK